MYLVLNNLLQRLICHKTKQTKTNLYMYIYICVCVCVCVCKNKNSHTQRDTKYSLVSINMKKRKKRKKKKNICKDQKLLWTIISNRTFTDTNPGIERNYNPIRTMVANFTTNSLNMYTQYYLL